MKNQPRMTARLAVVLTLLVTVIAAPLPVAADAIAGCIMPLIPDPETLTERDWDARGLVMFLQKQAAVEIRTDEPVEFAIKPEYRLLGSDARGPVASGEAQIVRKKPGRTTFSNLVGGAFWDALTEDLVSNLGRRVRVHSVRTLEHDEELRYPPQQDIVALTLEFPYATDRGGEEINSHKLVLFLIPALDGSSK